MTTTRQEAMQMLENIPEDKLGFVLQIIRGVSGLIGEPNIESKKTIDLEQFIMPTTERVQNADAYVRELRDNDRI